MGFALEPGARAQQAVVRLLQQVLGHLAIAADARQVRPERARRPVVERAKGLFIHGERHVGDVGVRLQALDVGEGHISHGAREWRPD